MPAAVPNSTPLALRACKGVEIFTTAGITPEMGGYTPDQLRQVVENFYLLGEFRLGLLDPPLGIGHDDDQDVLTALLAADPRLAPYLTAATLDGDDAPAAGWITGVRLVPGAVGRGDVSLLADFKDIPGPIADLIDSRAYKRVSFEVYDDFEDGRGNRYGFALRRVALCGWQPPVNKAMADVPPTVAQFAEPRRLTPTARTRTAVRNTFTVFSEMRPMTKAQMLAALKGKFTLSDAAAAAMTDAEVGAIYRKFTEAPAPQPADSSTPSPDQPTRDQMIAELQAAGQPADQLAALTDEELTALYQQWKTGQPAPAQPAAQMAEVKKFAEEARRTANALKVELAKAQTHTVRIKQYAEETAKQHKKTKIDAARLDLCGANGVAHCTPAEFDTLHRETLEGLDDLTVKTFSEPNGNKVDRTPFAHYVAKLKALPAKKVFGEKVTAQILDGGDHAAGDGERQKVRVYAEQNEADVKKFHGSTDAFMAKFDKLREKDKTLTAAKFTGQAA